MLILKALSNQIPIDASNTVFDSKMVCIFNNSASIQTLKINGSNTFSIPSYSTIVIEKLVTDTLIGSNCLATSVKYRG